MAGSSDPVIFKATIIAQDRLRNQPELAFSFGVMNVRFRRTNPASSNIPLGAYHCPVALTTGRKDS
jgi:hypothetical protein